MDGEGEVRHIREASTRTEVDDDADVGENDSRQEENTTAATKTAEATENGKTRRCWRQCLSK